MSAAKGHAYAKMKRPKEAIKVIQELISLSRENTFHLIQLLRYMRDLEISIPHLNGCKKQQIHVPFGRSIYTCKLTHVLKTSEKIPEVVRS